MGGNLYKRDAERNRRVVGLSLMKDGSSGFALLLP